MFINKQTSFLSYCLSSVVVAILFISVLASCTDDQEDALLNPVTDLPPTAVVSDLQIVAVEAERIRISWTAPASNGENLKYEIRHYEDSLTFINWAGGVECYDVPAIADSGFTQTYDLTGLNAGKLSYIAIRTCNTGGIYGPMSENVSGTLPSFLATPISYSFSGSDIETSDLDADGDMDIVIIKEASLGDSLYTLRNDGTGRFTQMQALQINGDSKSVRIGDIDNDGFNDIVTLMGNKVFVFTNDGMGKISVTDTLILGLTAKDMQVGDFNGDGFADIITGSSSYGGKYSGFSALLAISFNDGAGGFEKLDTVNTTSGIASITVSDIDDDGDLDIVSTYTSSYPARILYNDGTGRNWDNLKYVNFGSYLPSVTIGDLNNDGWQDLIGASNYMGRITVATGSDGGNFNLKTSTPGSGQGTDIHLGDFDGDGLLDIARAFSTLTLHLNDGQGYFTGAAHYSAGSDVYYLSLDVADFNGDGHPDVAVLQKSENLMIFLSSL